MASHPQRQGMTHVIGAGMAGLSAALHLAAAGRAVSLYEGGVLRGGRCRSYEDKQLGCLIDNGNHLMLSGNAAILELLRLTGRQPDESLLIAPRAAFRFHDCRDGSSWTVDLGAGPWPGWIFDAARRIPGTCPRDYLSLLSVLFCGDRSTIGRGLGGPRLYEAFWEPLILGVMNLTAERADPRPLRRVLLETVLRGGRFSRPMIARHGLGPDLVEPVFAKFRQLGGLYHERRLLTGLETLNGRIAALHFSQGQPVLLGEGERVILAVPPGKAAGLVPGSDYPAEGEPIVNLHYRLPAPPPGEGYPVVGLIGGVAHWLFLRDDMASVTISAARHLPPGDDAVLAARVWCEIASLTGAAAATALPPWRMVREKRATFTQDRLNNLKRPDARTVFGNLFLAGDWTDTGLPATIEGAVRSGRRAARLAMGLPMA